MTSEVDPDGLVSTWLTVPEAAERLGEPVGRVRQLLREGRLVARTGGDPPTVRIPAVFIGEGAVLKGLAGTLTVLRDAGYDDIAALRWLFTCDDSLPGSPVQALAENRGTEVKRRAQALAF